MKTPFADRFWQFVDVKSPEECWAWKGETNTTTGRGRFWWRGRKQVAARVAYELAVGSIPAGLSVLHSNICADDHRCCNPHHLYIGTQADNMQDLSRKGTTRTIDPDIAKGLHDEGYTHKQIAKRYGVHRASVSNSIRRHHG